jgi:hypothetical protein
MKWQWPSLGLAVVLPVVGASVAGCIVTTEPLPSAVILGTEPAGTLVVDWSIELRTDPADCAYWGADSIRISVVERTGVDGGTYEQGCAAFVTSIVLARGSYAASAQLVDVAGVPRSTTVTLAPFSIFGNDELRAPIDFPAASFF